MWPARSLPAASPRGISISPMSFCRHGRPLRRCGNCSFMASMPEAHGQYRRAIERPGLVAERSWRCGSAMVQSPQAELELSPASQGPFPGSPALPHRNIPLRPAQVIRLMMMDLVAMAALQRLRRRIPVSGHQVRGRQAIACDAEDALDATAGTGTLKRRGRQLLRPHQNARRTSLVGSGGTGRLGRRGRAGRGLPKAKSPARGAPDMPSSPAAGPIGGHRMMRRSCAGSSRRRFR
jgi:hypothetical protein